MATTLIPLFSSSELTGCGYPGLLDRKNRSDMCPRWESNPRLPACKASTLSTRPGSPLIYLNCNFHTFYNVILQNLRICGTKVFNSDTFCHHNNQNSVNEDIHLANPNQIHVYNITSEKYSGKKILASIYCCNCHCSS